MDVLSQLQNFAWCKPDWKLPTMNKETSELLMQCANIPKVELSDDIEEIIEKSKAFPIPFPIETVRLKQLKLRRPIERLKKNIVSTYPLIHERVLLLMAQFLIYKREYGSIIEKALYKDMTIPDFIDRILKKRALVFMGRHDTYKLLTGEKASNGWETVGTMQQQPPLVLENCLSYDEMKIAAMVYVSGHTECINDGTRHNNGVVKEDNIETEAVIIGIIGPRFQRRGRMDNEDILITEQQNVQKNGYGDDVRPTNVRNYQSAKQMRRQMWSKFYQVNSNLYEDLRSKIQISEKTVEKQYTDRYVKRPLSQDIFDNEVYYKRISIIAETVLLEAEKRAVDAGRDAFLNVIGAGLGVWQVSPHQLDVYILTFLERIKALLEKGLLNHVSDVNFAYIKPSASISALFTYKTKGNQKSKEKTIFLESKTHPKGGINVLQENREPSSKLLGEHKGKLLVMTYAWDSNAHPGNEFWLGKLHSSGDPAAACSSQVSELHNAHVNGAVCARTARVAAARGLQPLPAYCRVNNRTGNTDRP